MKKLLLALSCIMLTTLLGGCLRSPSSFNGTNGNTEQSNQNSGKNNVNTGVTASNKLDLSNQGLTKVSQDVFTKTNLEELDVSDNRLTGALPAEIRHLQKLRILDASDNQMTGVPAEIGQLRELQVLDLSNNQLTGLPYELGNLKNLKTLNLSGNAYSEQDLSVIRASLPATVNIIL